MPTQHIGATVSTTHHTTPHTQTQGQHAVHTCQNTNPYISSSYPTGNFWPVATELCLLPRPFPSVWSEKHVFLIVLRSTF